MAKRRSHRGDVPPVRRRAVEAGARTRRGWYGLLAGVCACVAVGTVLVLLLTSPDDSRDRPSEVPATPDLPVASPAMVLPSTPAPATVEDLKQEALEVAGELLASFPQSPEAHHLMALLEKALRQTDEAQQYWQKCLELAPDHTRARVGLARVAIDQGNDEMAVETLHDGLAMGCSSPELYRALASSLIGLGRSEEAADVCQKGLATFAQSPEIWMLLGQAQIHKGELQQAQTSLRNAVELAPRFTDAHYALATACARQGQHEEAARCRQRFGELKARDRQLEDRLALVPDLDRMRQRTAATLCGAGTVRLRQGDLAEAERLLLRAAALAPGFPETYRELASLYHRQGRIGDALAVERRLAEVEPKNIVNYVNLAGLSMRLGDTASAEEALRQAIDARPEEAVAYRLLARLYLETGQPEQARPLAQQAVRREATAEGYALLASACRQLNDGPGAEAALQEARKLASNQPRREQVDPNRPEAR